MRNSNFCHKIKKGMGELDLAKVGGVSYFVLCNLFLKFGRLGSYGLTVRQPLLDGCEPLVQRF